MSEMGLILGILLLISGVLILTTYKKSTGGKNPVMLAVILLISGISGIVSFFYHSNPGSMASILFPVGFVCVYTPVNVFVQVHSCQFPIKAEFVRFEAYSGRGASTYYPVFRYNFEGGEYESQVPAAYFSLKRLERKYQSGHTYGIRINEKRPARCIDRRHVPVNQYLSLLFGLVLILILALCLIALFL